MSISQFPETGKGGVTMLVGPVIYKPVAALLLIPASTWYLEEEFVVQVVGP